MFKANKLFPAVYRAGQFLAIAAVLAGLPVTAHADAFSGALLGGIVGSRFGQGNGQIAATVVGAAIGADLGGRSDGPPAVTPVYYSNAPQAYYPQPVYAYREHHHYRPHHRHAQVYYPAPPSGAVIVMQPGVYYRGVPPPGYFRGY